MARCHQTRFYANVFQSLDTPFFQSTIQALQHSRIYIYLSIYGHKLSCLKPSLQSPQSHHTHHCSQRSRHCTQQLGGKVMRLTGLLKTAPVEP